jgi:Calcineurin-like phosphoesterase
MTRPEPYAVIGDIHGNARRLQAALEVLTAADRQLIFVGDYVDRGPDSRGVIDLLVDLRSRHDMVTFLRGNHDDTLLRWLACGDMGIFAGHGGLTTIASYMENPGPGVFDEFRKTYPSSHREFLASTVPFYEAPGLFVSHSGYSPGQPHDRGVDVVTYGRHPTLFHRPQRRPQDVVVFGHYVQQNLQPYQRDGIICIDTGCGTFEDGPLTVLLLPEHSYLQF